MTARQVLALDTNIIVLAVEGIASDAAVDAARRLVFETPLAGTFVASEVVLSEIIVRPLRDGNSDLVRFYRRLLTDLRAFRLMQVSRSILLEAARLRSVSSLKLPDAIHVATAVRSGCKALVTMDQGIRSQGMLPVMRPDDPALRALLQA